MIKVLIGLYAVIKLLFVWVGLVGLKKLKEMDIRIEDEIKRKPYTFAREYKVGKETIKELTAFSYLWIICVPMALVYASFERKKRKKKKITEEEVNYRKKLIGKLEKESTIKKKKKRGQAWK